MNNDKIEFPNTLEFMHDTIGFLLLDIVHTWSKEICMIEIYLFIKYIISTNEI